MTDPQNAEIEGIPEDRPCYRCGKNPAEGFASVWTAKDGERWYCHGDDDEDPTCYMTAQEASPDAVGFAVLDLSNPPEKWWIGNDPRDPLD
jgi:hypothetical protein